METGLLASLTQEPINSSGVSGVARILKFCRPIAERAPKVQAACARAPLAGPGACSPGEIFENCVFEIARNTLKLYNLAPCQC